MRIDSIIEDLEAQGYFANFSSNTLPKGEIAQVVKVVFIETQRPELLLRSPLRGMNFIGGFSTRNNKVSWIIIPDTTATLLETLFVEGEFLTTKLSFKKILGKSFIEQEITIALKQNAGELRGMLSKVTKQYLVLATGAKLTWVAKRSLDSVVVEKFNKLD